METHDTEVITSFAEQMEHRRGLVAEAVGRLTADFAAESAQHGKYVDLAVNSFVELQRRAGKGTRGAFATAGHELWGGEPDDEAAVTLGAAVQMLHGYLLVVDDWQDRSETRRGGLAAHVQIDTTLQQWGAKGDTRACGEGVAVSTALAIQHRTMRLLGRQLRDLNVPIDRREQVAEVLHEGLELTGIGQILDLYSSVRPDMEIHDAEKIATLKTACYSVLLPLKSSAALAGVPPEESDCLQPFALNAGRAFQLEDDRLGLYGTVEETGKSRKSDMVEGKRTVLYLTALELANEQQRAILERAHGNPNVSDEDFERSLQVIRDTGAYDEVRMWTDVYAQRAVASLHTAASTHSWPERPVQFLEDMAYYGAKRRS